MAAEGGMSKAVAKNALDAFIAAVTKAMKAGDKVALVGFGTFAVSERAERSGINPVTKQIIKIPAKNLRVQAWASFCVRSQASSHGFASCSWWRCFLFAVALLFVLKGLTS